MAGQLQSVGIWTAHDASTLRRAMKHRAFDNGAISGMYSMVLGMLGSI